MASSVLNQLLLVIYLERSRPKQNAWVILFYRFVSSMTSLNAALSFLSHIGISHADSYDLMKKLNNDMSRLMVCSNKELIECNLSLDMRLHLLRALHCFHTENWSKCLMNNFPRDQNMNNMISKYDTFEVLVYHLLKYDIWIVYTTWTLIYIRKYLVISNNINPKHIQLTVKRLQQIKHSIVKLKQIIALTKRYLV